MASLTLRPNGAGNETSISSQAPVSGEHWDKVDEEVADDADYVSEEHTGCGGNYYRDLYALPNSGIGAGVINSVTVYARLYRTAGGFADQYISLRTGSWNYDYVHNCGDSIFEQFSDVFTLNPQTGLGWTWAEINALEVGCKLANCNAQNARCSQVWVVVNDNLIESVPDFRQVGKEKRIALDLRAKSPFKGFR